MKIQTLFPFMKWTAKPDKADETPEAPVQEQQERQEQPAPEETAPRPMRLPLPIRGDNAAPERQPGTGFLTGRRLDELDSLVQPFVRDPFYRLRPPFSHRAAELSLELAQMTYTLELEPWKQAGWNDFSIQIDNTLQSGLTHGESADGERMQTLMNAWKLARAKAALANRNPFSQVMNTLRQRERSDTIKAVCMMHRLEDGHYLLAIGFMGTGKRVYDWISNFRFTTEEGFHKGFYQLCTYFEQGAENIVFPTTAKELGLERLTLGQVLSEMRLGGSRFRLWMAGHSQGGAVMQVFVHRLMTQWGVQPQNMVGYGFASPTVATGAFVYDPASYPLYHILNSDDSVPRMGALVHLGLCMLYPANDALRQATYQLSQLPADQAVRQKLKPYSEAMQDVESILIYGTAFMKVMAEEKGEETFAALTDKRWSVPFVDKLLLAAEDKTMGWIEALVRQLHQGYEDLMGKAMDDELVGRLMEQMRPIVRETPFRRLMGGLVEYTAPPHHLSHDQHDGPYTYIVMKDLEHCRPFIWVKQEKSLPQRRFAEVDPAALRGNAETLPKGRRCAVVPAKRRAQPMGVQRRGHSFRRLRKQPHKKH